MQDQENTRPAGGISSADAEAFRRDGYLIAKELPNGEAIVLHSMLFTTALYIAEPNYAERSARCDLGMRRRFCYEHGAEAVLAAMAWDGEGDPPGSWVKEKSPGVDRLNPRLADENFGQTSPPTEPASDRTTSNTEDPK